MGQRASARRHGSKASSQESANLPSHVLQYQCSDAHEVRIESHDATVTAMLASMLTWYVAASREPCLRMVAGPAFGNMAFGLVSRFVTHHFEDIERAAYFDTGLRAMKLSCSPFLILCDLWSGLDGESQLPFARCPRVGPPLSPGTRGAILGWRWGSAWYLNVQVLTGAVGGLGGYAFPHDGTRGIHDPLSPIAVLAMVLHNVGVLGNFGLAYRTCTRHLWGGHRTRAHNALRARTTACSSMDGHPRMCIDSHSHGCFRPF